MNKLTLAVIFTFFFLLYARMAAPGVTTGDSGEFATVAETLSIAHAPSYPLYAFAGKAWTSVIPWGNAAYKTNVFSAFTSSLALVFLALFFGRMAGSSASGAALAVLFGVTRAFWINSLVTEVFSLHILIVSVVLFLFTRLVDAREEKPWFRTAALISFVLGIGAGNHHTLVFLVPTALILYFWRRPFPWTLEKLGLVLAAGLVGFSIYGSLMVRAAKDPVLNWGKPTTVHGLTRTILRKDYGAFQLALGEQPDRSLANTVRQQKRFFIQMDHEASWPFVLFGLTGLLWGAARRDKLWVGLLALFLLSGPFFYALSHLPFTAQSFGIMERFLILPLIALVAGAGEWMRRAGRGGAWAAVVFLFLILPRTSVHAGVYRPYFLVQDYGRAMLRTVPNGGALFLDGGDDAFYSLAYLHEAENRRPDLKIHDRGGLIFANPYGADFRRIPKERKTLRRAEIEMGVYKNRPLYYSSMDPQVLPGVPTRIEGFLLKAGPSGPAVMRPELMILRSLYPLRNQEFRSRALAAFFPFMEGWRLKESGRKEEALPFFQRAAVMGADVGWLPTNLGHLYAKMGYENLQQGNLDFAEQVYRQWRTLEPDNDQPWTNLGVVYERQGRLADSRQAYRDAMTRFPDKAQAVYNLAVLHWHQADWPVVVDLFQEVLRRDPDYPGAAQYLFQAKQKLGAS